MAARLRRLVSAFFTALRLTLRGETLPARPVSPLDVWLKGYRQRLTAVTAALEANGLDQAARQQVSLKLDGRTMSLETVLATLRFHAEQEYPDLLKAGGQRARNAIYAGSMNDHYWATRLSELAAAAPAAAALAALRAHLEGMPE